MAIEVGSIVEGVVTGITHFGAFVMLPDGKTGLVHISEVADEFVKDIKDYVKENDRVMVKVLSVDEKGKVGLSIKQARPDYVPRPRDARKSRSSFEEKLARFLKESDERLQDLRRNAESKRGGRGSGRKSEMAWD
ncbi:MAG: S1 RNA-binding domain-containing protein [Bacillota bacterium]